MFKSIKRRKTALGEGDLWHVPVIPFKRNERCKTTTRIGAGSMVWHMLDVVFESIREKFMQWSRLDGRDAFMKYSTRQ